MSSDFHKEELEYIHLILWATKDYLLRKGIVEDSDFENYNEFILNPDTIGDGKSYYKKATLCLAEDLRNIFKDLARHPKLKDLKIYP